MEHFQIALRFHHKLKMRGLTEISFPVIKAFEFGVGFGII